jgi:superfamily II DNA/RNA helicase
VTPLGLGQFFQDEQELKIDSINANQEKKNTDDDHDDIFARMNVVSGCTPLDTVRESVKKFREGRTNGLLVSDYYMTGIDIAEVHLLVNYDIPPTLEVYVRRAGRCGRFGRRGEVLSFVSSPMELMRLQEFAKVLGVQLQQLDSPAFPHSPTPFQSYTIPRNRVQGYRRTLQTSRG